MASRSEIELKGFFQDLSAGSRTISPVNIINTTSPATVLAAILALGDNTFNVPSNTKGAIIVFAAASVTVKKLKGAAGDTGITLLANSWNVITFAPGVTEFIINSSAADVGNRTEVVYF